MKKITLSLVLLLLYQFLSAQTTYTFIGNGNWSDSLNWQGSTKPPTPVLPNSIINIQPATGGQCIVDVPVTIPATATLNVTAGSQFVILGNLTVLSNNSYATRLAKVWQLYNNTSGGYDTVAALIYFYDSANRLVKKVDCEFDTNTSDTGYLETSTYYYYAGDTLSYRKVRKSSTVDTTFYSYYSNGKRASDSVVYRSPYYGYYANNYVYDNDTIRLTSKTWYANPGIQTYTRHINVYQTRHNGNITHQHDTGLFKRWSGGFVISVDTVSLRIISTYLQNPNPFYPTMKGCRKLMLESELGMEDDYTPKNLLSHQQKISSTQNQQETHTYLFRSDGYPLEAYATNGSENYKLVFVYD